MAKSPSSTHSIVAKDTRLTKKTYSNIRFIVPMPGKGSWHNQPVCTSTKKIRSFSHQQKDLAIEDFQVQFLMEREYPID